MRHHIHVASMQAQQRYSHLRVHVPDVLAPRPDAVVDVAGSPRTHEVVQTIARRGRVAEHRDVDEGLKRRVCVEGHEGSRGPERGPPGDMCIGDAGDVCSRVGHGVKRCLGRRSRLRRALRIGDGKQER